MRNYNKSDIIAYLALQHPEHSKAYFQLMVDETLDAIKHFSKKGEKLSLTNFGTFKPKIKPACEVRNPKTGERVKGKAKVKIQFKPSRSFSPIDLD